LGEVRDWIVKREEKRREEKRREERGLAISIISGYLYADPA
jgi:hypothetical protein